MYLPAFRGRRGRLLGGRGGVFLYRISVHISHPISPSRPVPSHISPHPLPPLPSLPHHPDTKEQSTRTRHTPRDSTLYRHQTLPELILRGAQFLEGAGQVLKFVVEALFHGAELLGGEGREVDCEGVSGEEEGWEV